MQIAGIELEAPTKHQLLTATEIGKYFRVSAQKVNKILCKAGYQIRVSEDYEPTEKGEPYAVMLDVGKRHSNGTPVRHLKWETSFLTEINNLFN